MSRQGAHFGFSIIWFLLGAAFFTAVLLFFKPNVSNDYAYALSLYKNNKTSEFITAVELYLPRASADEAKKLLRLSLELDKVSVTPDISSRILAKVPDGYLSDQTIFDLLKILQRRAKNELAMETLYQRANKVFDAWVAELGDDRNPNMGQRLSRVFSLISKSESMSFSSLFRIAAERTKSPEIMYGAALLNALRGDMERALEYYPVSINKDHLEGRIDLLVSAGKNIEVELLNRIDINSDKPKLVALKAQEEFKAGFDSDAFRTYFLLLSRLDVSPANIDIADSLLYFARHNAYNEDVKTLTRQSNELLKNWNKLLTISVPLDSFGFDSSDNAQIEEPQIGHDEAISALWYEFGKDPSDSRLWKTLGWFLVHDRDDKGLEKLLLRIKTPLHPYYLLYSGCLQVLREQYDAALRYFEQAGRSGLAQGYLCMAEIQVWQGHKADAKETRGLAERFILIKGDNSHDAAENSNRH